MTKGIERAPVYPHEPAEPWTGRQDESVMAFHLVSEHNDWTKELLKLDGDSPYQITEADLQARRRQLDVNKNVSHFTARSVFELGTLVLATTAQVEGEFSQRMVLDIGSGQGRFGEKIARNAKAKVTFLDNDPELLRQISPRSGEKVEADGRNLPFDDESFDRVMCAFSTVFWAANPLESAQAINEALRVVKVDGSAIMIPLLTNLYLRHANVDRLLSELSDTPNPLAAGDLRSEMVWAAQDHVLINTLLKLAEGGYCEITWNDMLDKVGSLRIEYCSAIVDKLKPIPKEFFDQNLEYARRFMPKGLSEKSREN